MEQRRTGAMPVIVHHSLRGTVITTCLTTHRLRVRVSETSSERSVIFPASKVAFFYLHVTPNLLSQIDNPEQRSGLLHSVAGFVEVHGHCYIVLETSSFCEKTFALMGEIQTQHLNSRLQIIPAHSANEAATAMVDIAKLQCKPLADKMHARFCALLNRLLLEDASPRLLSLLGLDSHQQQMLQDGIGSLSRLAATCISDLTDCALDRQTAVQLTGFFATSSSP